jgi:uncharacterized protein (TIGR00725 family)
MMEAAARGASRAGGLVIGILPGTEKKEANPYISIPIPTGLGVYRNATLVHACDALIAIRGAAGTLSEIALALRIGRPVITLQSWSFSPPDKNAAETIRLPFPADTPEEAVQLAVKKAHERLNSVMENGF